MPDSAFCCCSAALEDPNSTPELGHRTRSNSDSMSADEEPKLYSSTAGTYFTDKESLAEHYRSELHQYNLRRKVAGLPPVTREWFDARKDQLQGTAAAAPQKTWFDPLTKKRFGSENTYLAHINSKKYKELVSKSGVPAPEPVVQLKRSTPAASESQSPGGQMFNLLCLPNAATFLLLTCVEGRISL